MPTKHMDALKNNVTAAMSSVASAVKPAAVAHALFQVIGVSSGKPHLLHTPCIPVGGFAFSASPFSSSDRASVCTARFAVRAFVGCGRVVNVSALEKYEKKLEQEQERHNAPMPSHPVVRIGSV